MSSAFILTCDGHLIDLPRPNFSAVTIELGTPVRLDSSAPGVVIGHNHDIHPPAQSYDVRLADGSLAERIAQRRLTIDGPTRRDVIGRDLPFNPRRRPSRAKTG